MSPLLWIASSYFFAYLWFLMWRDSIYSRSQENHRLHDHRLHNLQYCELHSWGIYNIAPTCTTRICGRELPFLCFMQCTHIFFTQASAGGECESPIRELKQGPQALAVELMLTLSRWPPAPPGLERPKQALEGGCAHQFSTHRVMELWLGLHYWEFPGFYGETYIPGIFQSCKMLTFI